MVAEGIMIGEKKDTFDLDYKKIWQATHVIPTLFFLILCMFPFPVAFFRLVITGTEGSILILFVELICIICFLINLYKVIHEVRHYNYLVDNGVLLTGEIQSCYGRLSVRMKVLFIDESGNKYIYNQADYKIYDLYKLRIFVMENPVIYILANKDNYQDGYILFVQYCDAQDWTGFYEKHPPFIKQRYIPEFVSNAKTVTGKLVKDSIKIAVDNKNNATLSILDDEIFYILEADITYFDVEQNEMYLFVGQCIVEKRIVRLLHQAKEDIFVQVEYNLHDKNQYIVHMDEAIASLE